MFQAKGTASQLQKKLQRAEKHYQGLLNQHKAQIIDLQARNEQLEKLYREEKADKERTIIAYDRNYNKLQHDIN